MSEDQRSELLRQKIEVDERLGRMKTKLHQARTKAYVRRQFLSPSEYASLENRITRLKSESQWLQMEIGKLKKQPIKEPS